MNTPEQLPEGSSLKDAGRKIREIITYLRSLRLIAGPGIRISQYTSGIIISGPDSLPGHGNSSSSYNGMFAVAYDAEANKVTVSPGFCYVNGFYVKSEELSCSPGNGLICLTVTRSSGGNRYTPGLKVNPGSGEIPDFPAGKNDDELTVIYPLASITQIGDNDYTVKQIHRYNPPILTIYGEC